MAVLSSCYSPATWSPWVAERCEGVFSSWLGDRT